MKSGTGKARWLRATLLAVPLAVAVLALTAAPAFAGTLTNVSWSVSNSQTGKTAVTYAFSMTTATAGTIKTVTMTVPAGTAGTPAVGSVYGLGAGTVALAANTITYTVTTAVSVAAHIPIYLSFTGLTNTSTAGSYTSTETTQTAAPATIDTGTSQSVTFGSSSTGATVTVGQTLTFTNSTPSFSLTVDPTGTASSSQAVTLTLQTNAHAGYTLAAYDSGLTQSGVYTIPAVSSGPGTGVATFPANGFGLPPPLRAAAPTALPGLRAHRQPVRRVSVVGGHLLKRHRPNRCHARHAGADRPGGGQLRGTSRHLHRHHHLRGHTELLTAVRGRSRPSAGESLPA